MIQISARLPKDYEPRTMYLYIAKTRSKWGFWFSDGKGYSVPALLDGITMTDHFTTRHAAAHFAAGQGWKVWPRVGRRAVPSGDPFFSQGSVAEKCRMTTAVKAQPRNAA